MHDKVASVCALGVIALAGCSSTGVLQSGSDKYMISKSDHKVGFGPPTAAHAAISQEADEFCAKQNKKVEIVNATVTHPALGRLGSATLEFRCIPK